MIKGKKILLGISGSIAAYKTAYLLRLLMKEGAEVQVIMTPAARDFVTPLTLSTLSQQPVLTDLKDEQGWENHVMLGRWAELLLIAPASANTLAKMAHGLCDNLLTAVYLSATCPVVFAPAMDEEMWHHPATRDNLEKIISRGHIQIPVETGDLASGLFGEGRMAEPSSIVSFLEGFWESKKKPLTGRKALVTAGPTHEPLDPVRFLGNYSSGKMGIAIANALADAGASVELVLGPTYLTPSHPLIKVTRVTTAEEMFRAAVARYPLTNIAVMAAAVADYRPKVVAENKIKKTADKVFIELEKTHDILKTLGNNKDFEQVLVGFSLETNNEKENALKKLREKNLDLIVLNSLQDEGAGFQHDTNKITIFDQEGRETSFPLQSKTKAARDIVEAIIELQDAKKIL
ncbi:MAG: bifunctional phosphopantothenoylcysteine decarboxylase/phosphopantothenate--cysteine ligase CoaBC [Chitinophagaceae bacterium]